MKFYLDNNVSVEDIGRDLINHYNWLQKCIGKTLEECNAQGFGIANEWLVEVSE